MRWGRRLVALAADSVVSARSLGVAELHTHILLAVAAEGGNLLWVCATVLAVEEAIGVTAVRSPAMGEAAGGNLAVCLPAEATGSAAVAHDRRAWTAALSGQHS